MQNYWHNDYYVMLEQNHNGSIHAVASHADKDHRISMVYYDYTLAEIKANMGEMIDNAISFMGE